MLADYATANHVSKAYHCRACQDRARLIVRWNAKAKSDEVVCGRCGEAQAFERNRSLTQLWRENPDAVPNSIADVFERKYGKAMSEQSLAQATETQMVKRIEGARWLAELKPQDRQSLAHLAVRYGLDPLMKELTIYEGSPYIPVAGLIRIAHRQKMFAGLEDRPMTGEERTQYGYKAPFCWIVKAYRKDWKCPAVGTGTADPAQPFRNNPIERTRPEWMARSRAIRQALKLAFPHSLPFEEVETAEEMGIDPETGEIIDSTAVEVAPDVVEAEAVEIEPEPADFAAEPADDDPRTDMRRQIAELAETRLLSNKQIDKWCLEHYQTDFAGTSLDGLLALKDKLAAMPEKKAS